jgi:hypothetical protein
MEVGFLLTRHVKNTGDDMLDGEDVLPGLSCVLSSIL